MPSVWNFTSDTCAVLVTPEFTAIVRLDGNGQWTWSLKSLMTCQDGQGTCRNQQDGKDACRALMKLSGKATEEPQD